MTDIINTIEADLTKAWGTLVGIAEDDAQVLWADFKSIFTKLAPAQYTILSSLVSKAILDVETRDLADIETALLNSAQAELTWITELGSEFLQAFIAVIKTSIQPVANVATSTVNAVVSEI